MRAEPPHAHRWAYAAIAGGAVLVGSSFVVAKRADDTYEAYLRETEPQRIEQLYDRTVFYDGVARAALLTGEALIATGIYIRFIRRSAVAGGSSAGPSLALEPTRCAVTWRF